jgi:hypothetical protein
MFRCFYFYLSEIPDKKKRQRGSGREKVKQISEREKLREHPGIVVE